MAASIPHLRFVILHTLLTGRGTVACMSLSRAADLDCEGIRGNALAIDNHVCRRNIIGTALGGYHNIRISDGRRRTGMAIYNLIAGLHRAVRSYKHLQFIGDITSPELADILRVYGISQPELLSHSYMRGSRGRQRLGRDSE